MQPPNRPEPAFFAGFGPCGLGDQKMRNREIDVLNKNFARSDIYKCFGASFTSPVGDFFPNHDEYVEFQNNIDAVAPECAKSAVKLVQAFTASDRDILLVEFSRLFVGPFHVPAPPYGSIYIDDGGKMMGASTIKAREFYRDSGLSMREDFGDVPDHVSAELEFMQYLCYRQGKAESEGNKDLAEEFVERQRFFNEAFLAPWIPSFCAKILINSENEVYVALSDSLVRFVEFESQFLNGL